MTAQDIIVKLFHETRPVDMDRVAKAQGLAARSKIEWAVVLVAMTDAQRKAVENAQGA